MVNAITGAVAEMLASCLLRVLLIGIAIGAITVLIIKYFV